MPYHELREHLRTATAKQLYVRGFMKAHPGARMYEATHDSDLVGLRLKADSVIDDVNAIATGLYSYYLDIIQGYASKGDRLPEVMSTGHRVVYERDQYNNFNHFAWLYQAIEEDRYSKRHVFDVDFRGAYVSEPNCLYVVPEGAAMMPYSYLLLPNGQVVDGNQCNAYDPCESMAIMGQIYKAGPDSIVHFDPTHPVLMKAPDRMLKIKTSGTAFDLSKLGTFDLKKDQFHVADLESALKFSAQISQSPFSYRDYAITLYRQLGLFGSSGPKRNLFISLACSIFNYFDIKNQTVMGNGAFKKPSTLTVRYLERNAPTDPGERGQLVAKVKSMMQLKTVRGQLNRIERLLNDLFQGKTPGVGKIIRGIAEAMDSARIEHYQRFFSAPADLTIFRTSPSQALLQSLHRNEPIKKEPL